MRNTAVFKWIIGLLALVFSLSATAPAWAAATKAATSVTMTAGGGTAGQTAIKVDWVQPGGSTAEVWTVNTYVTTCGTGTLANTSSTGTLGTGVSAATSLTITTGLTAGTTYCSTVTGTSTGNTASSVTSATAGVKALTKLATPTSITLTKGGSAASPSVTVGWGSVANASSYSIELSTSSTFASGNLTAQTSAAGTTSYVWTGLTSNTAYYARVTAVGDSNTYETSAVSAISATANSTTTLATPGTPTITKGGSSSSSSITISWTGVTNNQGYTVEYSTSSTFASGNSSTSAGTNATSIVVSSLTSNTTYYARITALGNTTLYATSAVSSISTGVASSTVLTAAAPTIATGGNSSSPSITVSWTSVTGNAGYTVEISTDSAFGTISATASPATNATTTVFTGLTSGATYYARIKVLGDGTNYVTSAFSSASTAGTASVQLATPSAPTVSKGGAAASPSITVSWTTVTGNAGYTIEYSTDATFATGVSSTSAATNATSKVISGLTSGATYYVRIKVLGDGTNYITSAFSAASSAVDSTSTLSTTSAPTISRGGGTGASITVSWTGVLGNAGYLVEVSTDSTFATGVTSQNASTDATSIVFSSLTGGATYYARVTAIGNGTTSATSAASAASTGVTTITTLSTPATPTITKGGSSSSPSITISWTNVTNNSGYSVQYSTSSTFASGNVTTTVATNITTLVVSGLASNATYYARITALGDGSLYGDSSVSSTSTGVASSTQLTATAPTLTKGGAAASPSVTVSWTNVTGNAGYTVEFSTDSTFASGVTTYNAATNATSYVFTGLSSATTYYARIKVLGDGTNYITSSFSSASTGVASSTLLVAGTPTVTKGGSTSSPSITISWTNVTGNAGYTIEYSTSATFASGVSSTSAATNATTVTISSLTSGTTYYVRITVIGDGTNTATSAVSSTASGDSSTRLSAPTPTITKGGAAATPSITISWTAVTGAASYTVEYSTSSTFASGNASTTAAAGDTSIVISGLTSNITYYARITVVGDGTNYITSAVSSISTGVASTTTNASPAAPTIAKGGSAASPSVTVSWTAVTGNGGYYIELSTTTGFTSIAATGTAAANATSLVITGLTSNTAYYARITVIGDGTTTATGTASARSSSANSTTTLATVGTPTVTKGGSASSPSVTVTWTGVTNNNGYSIDISTDNTFASGVTTQSAAQGAISLVISGLTSNTTYYVRIKALGDTSLYANAASYSSTSTGANSSTQLSAPSTPTLTKGGTVSSTSITVTWNSVTNNAGYIVEISTDSTFSTGVISNTVSTGSTSLVVTTGVSSATTYYARVKVLGDGTNYATSASYSSVSNGVASSTTLSTVTTVSVTTEGSSSSSAITVTWTGVSNNSGYQVQISTGSGFGTIAATCNAVADATSCVFSSLTSNITYYVRILALGDGNNYSNAAAYSTAASGTSSLVLSTPTATLSTGSASGTLSVSWSSVASATSYTIRLYSDSGLNTLVGSAYTNATSPFSSFTGLSQGVTYYVTVQAIGTGSATVSSSASASSSARTKSTLIITPGAKSITYGAAVPSTAFYTFTYTSGFIAGESAANAAGFTAPTCTSTYTQSTATTAGVKTGAITCSGGAATYYNFDFTAVADLTVNKATLTATPDALTATYGANVPSYTFVLSGFVNSETKDSGTFTAGYGAPSCTSSYQQVATGAGNAGTYPISCSGGSASNYTLSFGSANLVVSKKAITVTPTDYSITYGAPAPAYAFSYSAGDFANGETSGSSTFTTGLTAPVCSSNYVQIATGAGNVGSNQITCTSGSATNYTFTIANSGKFVTVTKKTLTVSAVAQTATYGDAAPTYTFSLSGFANSENKDSATFTTGYTAPTCTSNYTQTAGSIHSLPGSYAISCLLTNAVATNYDFSFTQATDGANLVVSKKTLTITADPKSATYGQAPPAYTATTTGWATAYPSDTFSTNPTCSSAYRTNDDAGTYPINCSLAAAGAGYDITYAAGTLTVGTKTLSIIGPDTSLEYGTAGLSSYSGFTYSGLINNDPVTGTVCTSGYTRMDPVGTYVINCSGSSSSNYTISFVPGTLSITPRGLTVTAEDTSVTFGDAVPGYLGYIATGFLGADTFDSGKAPLCITTYTQGSSVVSGGYTVTCNNPSQVAVASNYTISYVSGKLTVNPYSVTVTGDTYTKTYGEAKPSLGYTDSGFILGGGYSTNPTCTTTYSSSSPVSSYPVTCSGGATNGNFVLSYVNGTIHVDKRAMTITASTGSVVYGTGYTVTYTVSALTPWINGDGFNTAPSCSTAYYTSATTTASVGTYPTTCSGAANSNYSFDYVNGSLSVTVKSLTLTANSYNITYGTAKPTIEFTVNGLVGTDALSANPTCTTQYNAGSVIGSYYNTCSGADVSANYSLPAGSYYTGITSVSRRTLSVKLFATVTYGDALSSTAPTIEGFYNTDHFTIDPTCTTTYVQTLAGGSVGVYPTTCNNANTGNIANSKGNNYVVVYSDGQLVNGAVTVIKKVINFKAEDLTVRYGTASITVVSGPDPGAYGLTWASAGFSKPICTNSYTTTTAVGTYAISCEGGLVSSNFTLNVSGAILTVLPKQVTVTPRAVSPIEYGSAKPSYLYDATGFIGLDNFTHTPTCVSTYEAGSAVGTYTITCSGATAPNYEFIAPVNPVTFTVFKKQLTVSAPSKTATYGDLTGTLTPSTTGFWNTDNFGTAPTCSVTGFTQNADYSTSPVGTYVVTCSGAAASNYNITYLDGSYSVLAKRVTVTATDRPTVIYGDAALAGYNYTVFGFIPGESWTLQPGTGTAPSCTSTYATYSPVGDYLIKCASAAYPNYTFRYVDGYISVSPKPLIVIASSAKLTYGSDVPATWGKSFDGLLNNDWIAGISCASTYSKTKAAGTYQSDIICSGGTNTNYSISYQRGNLTVDPRPITVTAGSYTVTYGDTVPSLNYTSTAFVNGETFASVLGCSTNYVQRSSYTADGYEVVCNVTVSPNYSLTNVRGKITVLKRDLTFTANGAEITYGGTAPTFSAVMATGVLLPGDTLQSNPNCQALSYHQFADAGDYTISCAGADAGINYNPVYVNATLKVGKKALTVTAKNLSTVYGTVATETDYSTNGFVNGDGFSTGPTCVNDQLVTTGVGEYDSLLTCSGAVNDNYSIGYAPGILTVTPLELTVSANSDSTVYGTNFTGFDYTDPAFINGDSFTVAPVCESDYTVTSNVGDYTINCSAGEQANYTFTYVPATLTVTQRSLVLKAKDVTLSYGMDPEVYTVVGTGWVNGDGITSAPTCFTTPGYAAFSAVGTYVITCADAGVSGNYSVTYTTGTLTVTKQAIHYKASNKTITYGGSAPGYGFTYTGLLPGDSLGITPNCTSTYSSDLNSVNSNAGSYVITCSGAVNANYDIEYTDGTLTVNPLDVTVYAKYSLKAGSTYGYCTNDGSHNSVGDCFITYGDNSPTFSYTSSTLFLNGKTWSSVGFTAPSCSSGYTKTSSIGSYQVKCQSGVAPNYNLIYSNILMPVVKKDLVIMPLSPGSVTYGDAAPVYKAASPIGFVNGDKLTTQPICSSTYQVRSSVGQYTVSCNGDAANVSKIATQLSNYAITYNTATFNVVQRVIQVVPTTYNLQYFDDVPGYTYAADMVAGDSWDVEPVCTSDYTKGAAPQTFAITCTTAAISDNYDLQPNAAASVVVTPRHVTLTGHSFNVTYGETAPVVTTAYDVTGLVNGDQLTGITCTTAYKAKDAVTTANRKYTVVCSATGTLSSNYTVDLVNGEIVVAKKALTVTATRSAASSVYGVGASFSYTTSGLLDGESLSLAPVCGVGLGTATHAGTHTVTCRDAVADNYDISYQTASWIVTKKAATITGATKTITTGQSAGLGTGSISGLINGDTLTVSASCTSDYSVFSPERGTYAVNCSGAVQNDYEFSYVPGTLTVKNGIKSLNEFKINGIDVLGGGTANVVASEDIVITKVLTDAANSTATVQGLASLKIGDNLIRIVVTAEDGSTANFDAILHLTSPVITPVVTEVPAGGSSATYGGVPISITPVTDPTAGTVTVTVGGLTLSLGTTDSSGAVLPLVSNGLMMGSGDKFVLTLSGYLPGSEVKIWVMSTPTLVGTYTADANGVVTINTVLPSGLAAGSHTLQLSGLDKDRQQATLSFGMTVATTKTGKATLAFKATSPKPSTPQVKQIAALAKSLKGAKYAQVTLTGSVVGKGSSADTKLAKTRDKAIANLIALFKSNGITATYVSKTAKGKQTGSKSISVAVGLSWRN